MDIEKSINDHHFITAEAATRVTIFLNIRGFFAYLAVKYINRRIAKLKSNIPEQADLWIFGDLVIPGFIGFLIYLFFNFQTIPIVMSGPKNSSTSNTSSTSSTGTW